MEQNTKPQTKQPAKNRNTRAKQRAATESVVTADAVVTAAPVVEKKKIVAKDIDPNQYVTVRNGFQGKLVYVSKKTGEKFIWNEFGDEQEMEFREVKDAKNTYKKFFINNWFMFDEDWVVEALGISQYYKHAVKIEDFDHIFSKDPDEVRAIVSEMSDGQKKSVAYRAKMLISEGKIDSLSVITTLEECLGAELIER